MTETIVIDGARALQLVREVVAEHGADTVYNMPGERCRYVWNDACSCLVGHALHRAGVPIDVLAQVDDGNKSSIEVAEIPGCELDDQARWIFVVAQEAQDSGFTWGRAGADAEEIADDLGVVAQ